MRTAIAILFITLLTGCAVNSALDPETGAKIDHNFQYLDKQIKDLIAKFNELQANGKTAAHSK